jgi:phosphotransferase system  glucose/maltose/N-acetylglucosamine-specific IIC component
MPFITGALSKLLQIDVSQVFYVAVIDPVLLKPQFDSTGWFVIIFLALLVILSIVAAMIDGF